MSLPKLTLAKLKRAATDKSFARGESYFHAEAVISATLRQQTLRSEVEGNEIDPYQVTITFDGGGVTNARCSCQYSFEGWCKHIVATLLVCLRQPETIEARPPLSQLLEQLSLVQAREMIQSLVAEKPALLESIDFYVSSLAQEEKSPTPKSPSRRKTSVNPEPYKRQVREILRNAVKGWEYGDDGDSISADLEELMLDVIAFAEQGDGQNALVVIKSITEACAQYWVIVDDFIGLGPSEFGIEFDAVWTEILLGTDLSQREVENWQAELVNWQDVLGGFEMALEALRQGWDYPPLLKVFQGEITEKGAWEGEAPDWADEFSQIRLKVLRRDERYEDYLLLAEAEGRTKEYLTMLGQLGRTEEAMTVAGEQMATLSEAIALAKTLRDQAALPQALDIAMRGLRLNSGKEESTYGTFEFANWTQDLAEGLKDETASLEASIFAFKSRPSLKGYQAIESLSGNQWAETKEQLLEQIRQMSAWQEAEAQLDILLHEALLDDAIKKVSGFNSFRAALTWRVMDEAIVSHSQWIIDTAIPKAQAIINEGRSKDYITAIEWLKRAKAAYLAQSETQAWQHYRQEIASVHGRKRKLMELLRQNSL